MGTFIIKVVTFLSTTYRNRDLHKIGLFTSCICFLILAADKLFDLTEVFNTFGSIIHRAYFKSIITLFFYCIWILFIIYILLYIIQFFVICFHTRIINQESLYYMFNKLEESKLFLRNYSIFPWLLNSYFLLYYLNPEVWKRFESCFFPTSLSYFLKNLYLLLPLWCFLCILLILSLIEIFKDFFPHD